MEIPLNIDIIGETFPFLPIWDGISILRTTKSFYFDITFWKSLLRAHQASLACPFSFQNAISKLNFPQLRRLAFQTARLDRNLTKPHPTCRWATSVQFSNDEHLLEMIPGTAIATTYMESVENQLVVSFWDLGTKRAGVLESFMYYLPQGRKSSIGFYRHRATIMNSLNTFVGHYILPLLLPTSDPGRLELELIHVDYSQLEHILFEHRPRIGVRARGSGSFHCEDACLHYSPREKVISCMFFGRNLGFFQLGLSSDLKSQIKEVLIRPISFVYQGIPLSPNPSAVAVFEESGTVCYIIQGRVSLVLASIPLFSPSEYIDANLNDLSLSLLSVGSSPIPIPLVFQDTRHGVHALCRSWTTGWSMPSSVRYPQKHQLWSLRSDKVNAEDDAKTIVRTYPEQQITTYFGRLDPSSPNCPEFPALVVDYGVGYRWLEIEGREEFDKWYRKDMRRLKVVLKEIDSATVKVSARELQVPENVHQALMRSTEMSYECLVDPRLGLVVVKGGHVGEARVNHPVFAFTMQY